MSKVVEESRYGMCGSGDYRDSGEFIFALMFQESHLLSLLLIFKNLGDVLE